MVIYVSAGGMVALLSAEKSSEKGGIGFRSTFCATQDPLHFCIDSYVSGGRESDSGSFFGQSCVGRRRPNAQK